MQGTIVKVVNRGFGFIAPSDGGPDIWFHAQALKGLPFDKQLVEMRVEYEVELVSGNWRASWVRAIE